MAQSVKKLRSPALLVLVLIVSSCGPVKDLTSSPQGPWTRAELTDAQQTSSLDDVNAFIRALKDQGAPITVSTLGQSEGGHDIPMVVLADPPCSNGQEARDSGRAVVYLQANIHGGEVEGKEVALALLRDASRGQYPLWLPNLVIVCVPVYNVDGNEALGPALQQRGHQDGPDPVGRRTNDDRLDLNRDCLKADSPEMRAVLNEIWAVWDPHVVLDLHTTNGTRHGYSLTYSPPLGADVDPEIQRWSKKVLLRDVADKLREKYGLLTFDYGNSSRRENPRTWRSFSPLPRYVTNHAGARNRFGILSEATSFLPFSHRIEATTLFTATVINHVACHVDEVIKICADADLRSQQLAAMRGQLGLVFETTSRGTEQVLLEKRNPEEPRPAHKGPLEVEPVPHDIRVDFKSVESRVVPAGWLIPAEETQLIERIRLHRLDHEVITTQRLFITETFWVSDLKTAPRKYQNRINRTVEGELREENYLAKAGDIIVPGRQSQVRTAFWLLEADSPDGATTWSLLEGPPDTARPHPIRRIVHSSN